jgi:HEAT repeat protein
MNLLSLSKQVDLLLSDVDRMEPASFDLGTPEISESSAINELVNMGAEIVPLLIERLKSSESKKQAAHIVLVLNRIGDTRALVPLLDLRQRCQELENKNEWDYAVIGQCNLAIEHLQQRSR